MSESHVHACPDGTRLRISKIQEVRDQPMVQGIEYTYQVGPEGEAAEAAGVFDVRISFAPIFCAIATPRERIALDDSSADLVARMLDRGLRETTELRVTSDGAVTLNGEVLERLYPLSKP